MLRGERMKKLIAILWAVLMAISFAYAPSPRSDNAAPQVEISCGEFYFSDANPGLTDSIPAQELIFTGSDTRIIGGEPIESIFFSSYGIFSKDLSGYKKEITELDPANALKLMSANIPFAIYKSEANGLPEFVVAENRENIREAILDSDANGRHSSIILRTSFENGCEYALSGSESTTDIRTLNFGDVKSFDLVKPDTPRELVQAEVDTPVLEVPAAGCFDADSGEKEKDTSSYAYDLENHLINDFCAYGNNKEILHEAYCNDDKNVDVKEIKCPGRCKNGACVSSNPEKEFCIDTDQEKDKKAIPDNAEEAALRFGSKGATVGFYSSRESKYSLWEDYCTPDGKLVEYSCKNKKAGFNVIFCACSEGKCASPPYCMDTDGGNNPNSMGKAVGVDSSNSYFNAADECLDSKKLKEISCSPEGFKSEEIECISGCQNGKCLKERPIAELAQPIEEMPITQVPSVSEETLASPEPETSVIAGEIPASQAPGTVSTVADEPIAEDISCTQKTDCKLEEACLSQKCSACNSDAECGTGWKCNNEKCELNPVKEEDITCKETDDVSYIKSLKKQLGMLNDYEKILEQAEAKHKLAPKVEIAKPKQQPSDEMEAAPLAATQMQIESAPEAAPIAMQQTAIVSSKKNNGEPCTSKSQCKSDYCAGQGSNKKCQPVPRGVDASTVNREEPQIIPPSKLGVRCGEYAVCGSGICENSRCVYKGIAGESCLKDSNCLSNNCNEAARKCVDVPTASSSNLGIGRTCTSNGQCRSGKCSSGLCGKRAGAGCGKDGDCLSHNCQGGAGQISGEVCRARGEGTLCINDGDCATRDTGTKCVKNRCIKP